MSQSRSGDELDLVWRGAEVERVGDHVKLSIETGGGPTIAVSLRLDTAVALANRLLLLSRESESE